MSPPPNPKARFQRVPPTLRITHQSPISAYSKGARGLSVLLRVCGIFTATTVSPSLSPRQSLFRYKIRAGRNLPDKEFRYLRTVIVTADIHGDLGSKLRPACAGLTSYRNLSALVTCHTLYVVFLDLAECCVFVKQSVDPFHCDPATSNTGAIPGNSKAWSALDLQLKLLST